MPSEIATDPDSTIEVTYPEPVFTHPEDVKNVIALPDYRLAVQFFDGTTGIVEMKAMIEGEGAGMFAELRDPTKFRAVKIDIGTVTWPNGADLAPDAMHSEFRAHGEWRLE